MCVSLAINYQAFKIHFEPYELTDLRRCEVLGDPPPLATAFAFIMALHGWVTTLTLLLHNLYAFVCFNMMLSAELYFVFWTHVKNKQFLFNPPLMFQLSILTDILCMELNKINVKPDKCIMLLKIYFEKDVQRETRCWQSGQAQFQDSKSQTETGETRNTQIVRNRY